MISTKVSLLVRRTTAGTVVTPFNFIEASQKFFSAAVNKEIINLLLNMPKQKSSVELKQQRSKKKVFSSKYSASTITLQVLGNGCYGAPSSLYVFTDQTRYLFNCGEGTQRLAHEHKMKLSKLEHIFLTSKTWNKVGGLPGVALTIQDIGVPSITLHGPEGLEKLFEATKRFVILNDLHVKVASIDENTGFEDNVLNIDYVPLVETKSNQMKRSSESDESAIEEDTTEYYGSVGEFKRHLEITHEANDAKKSKLEHSDDAKASRSSDTALCYICRPKKKEGTLIIEKCVEKGVPPGPLLGRLKSGEDITLSDGTVVKADDVRSPDCPGPVFIVIDCPEEKYLDSLINNQKFARHQNDAPIQQECAQIVIHFTPSRIMQNEKYLKWMESFRITTQHLLLNDFCYGMGSIAVHRIQYKLNILDSTLFPLLKEDNPRRVDVNNLKTGYDDTMMKVKSQSNIPVPVIFGETLLKYHLRPGIGEDLSSVVTLNPEEFVNETIVMDGFQSELESLHKKAALKLKETANDNLGDFPNFLFLGTGSCIPNKTRNTSGILINLSPISCLLMDCGEGTCGQIIRFFGKDGAKRILCNLKAIYVSHLHADHHLGLLNLLLERKNAFEDIQQSFFPVLLIAPQQINFWLNLYHHQFEKIKTLFELVACGNILFENNSLDQKYFEEKVLEPLNMTAVESAGVKHCPNAYGVAFTHKDGWKVTYSGDTMPCDSLVQLGKNSDVLIHEATMEDELKHEAVIKMHSTTSEAIEVGQKMNAKFVLLTHFSQRYAKVPIINEQFGDNVGIAFDNMNVRLSDLRKIPLLYPALKCMFAVHCEDMEFKTQKKLKNREAELKT